MMKRLFTLITILTVPLLLQGCGIGYNSVLFATRTNMGVDIDTKPPTAEISIARQEGVIEPVFGTDETVEGEAQEKTLPVLASFKSKVSLLGRLFVGVGSSFATGKAAATMTEFYTCPIDKCENPDKKTDYQGLTLSKPPQRNRSYLNPLRWFGDKTVEIDYLENGFVRPLFFGTHSTLGLKVEWNGGTGEYPSAVKFGYNRKEFAWVPVTLSKVQGSDKVKADIPSVLATLDSTTADDSLKFLQYFATGEAASNLALHDGVRDTLMNEIAPVEKEQ